MAGRGYSVQVLPGLDPRELIDPALMADLAQLVPESTGSAALGIRLTSAITLV